MLASVVNIINRSYVINLFCIGFCHWFLLLPHELLMVKFKTTMPPTLTISDLTYECFGEFHGVQHAITYQLHATSTPSTLADSQRFIVSSHSRRKFTKGFE